jgi:DNA-binding transcriptional regulator YhcF (GntR family)
MVGASREMVSRVMKDFEEKGFLRTLEGGSMTVNERRQIPR